MTAEPTEDDIRALHQDGDLSRYLRGLIRRPAPKEPARAGPIGPSDPRHTPGAWPHGTHPETSATCRPDCPCNPATHHPCPMKGQP